MRWALTKLKYIKWCFYKSKSQNSKCHQLLFWYNVPYSRKFSLVQIFAEMHPYSSEEIFVFFFYFVVARNEPLTTPLPDDGYAPYARVPKKWHWAMKWSKLSLLFVLCGGLHSYKGIKTACRRGRKIALLNRRVQHCWSRLHNFGASLTGSLVFCIHSSRLSLFCSNHLQGRDYFHGRQTEENHLVHTGTISTYHIMTSSIHLGSFFRSLYFRGSRSVCENRENFPLHAPVWK